MIYTIELKTFSRTNVVVFYFEWENFLIATLPVYSPESYDLRCETITYDAKNFGQYVGKCFSSCLTAQTMQPSCSLTKQPEGL